ncbi:C2H2 type zinc finger domain protein [Aspergillus udagawae]|uniref:C2H2 type zinc finger domain protein n=1 Tax=Aspergillus udagawae TaxID=91492 RepID=A0A8H3P5L6_9EURO|nr:C2H2 type zinc finger domain protein [Aspergillus udagawae]
MEQNMSTNPLSGRRLRCEICSFTFHRSDHLKRHLLIRMFFVDTGLRALNGGNQGWRFPRRILEVNISTPAMPVPA